jgi:CMP-N-acetylneuraminic acid synthetase
MNISDIGVWSCARTSSSRCKKKMIRPFGDSSLTDIFLKKLSAIGDNTFFGGYESIFMEKCQAHGIPFYQRTKESATVDEPAAKIYEFLCDQPYEHLLHVNPCLPFLKPESIIKFLEICIEDDKPKFAVFKKNNYYTDNEGKPYNFDTGLKTINTKNVSSVYEFAHVFYFFKKSYFLENGRFWDWNDVRYVEVNETIEKFDIDTEEQFRMAEAMWTGINFNDEIKDT